jgi:hypothetical protein
MKEKVEAGNDEPLDMLMQEMLEGGDVVDGKLTTPFILAA